MQKQKLFGILVALLSLTMLVTPIMAQENPFSAFTHDQLIQAHVDCLKTALSQGKKDFTGILVKIPAEGAEFNCTDLITYVNANGIGTETIVDYDWMIAPEQVKYYSLVGAANMRVGADPNARLIAKITPTDTPVVEVDAIDKATNRLLIRTPKFSGWVNNLDAKIVLDTPVTKPADWKLEVMPDSLNNEAGGESAPWTMVTLFAPNGDDLTDVYRTNTDLMGHGRLLHSSDSHFVFPVRENGRYNPSIVYNGFFQRVEGDTRRYFAGWQMGWLAATAIPGIEKLPIAGEFFVTDADEHRKVQFDPGAYVYVPMTDSSWTVFSQDEIMTWPQANTVLDKAVCPAEPVRLNVSGEYKADVLYYDAAIGNHKCPSYLIGLTTATASDEIEVQLLTPGMQVQNFGYMRDQSAFVMMPDKYTPAQTTAWVKRNLVTIAAELGLNERPNVRFTGVPGFADGIITVGSIAG